MRQLAGRDHTSQRDNSRAFMVKVNVAAVPGANALPQNLAENCATTRSDIAETVSRRCCHHSGGMDPTTIERGRFSMPQNCVADLRLVIARAR